MLVHFPFKDVQLIVVVSCVCVAGVTNNDDQLEQANWSKKVTESNVCGVLVMVEVRGNENKINLCNFYHCKEKR